MRKTIKFITSVICFFMFLVVLASLINHYTKTNYEDLSLTDQKMIKQLAEVYETFQSQGNEIWNKEFSFQKIPLVLTPTKKYGDVFHLYSYVIGNNDLNFKWLGKKINLPDAYASMIL